MTTSSTPRLIARSFTFDGRTFFITPEIHNSLLCLWRLESAVANTRFPHFSETHELHTRGRTVAEALGLTSTEWPAVWPADHVHNPQPARERNTRTVLALARAYSEATGHLIYRRFCYSGCVAHWYCINHAPETCRFLNMPCRCFLKHPPQHSTPAHEDAPVTDAEDLDDSAAVARRQVGARVYRTAGS